MDEKNTEPKANFKVDFQSPSIRIAFAVFGGVSLYILILLNFDIYRDMLNPYAYKISVERGGFPWTAAMITSVVTISLAAIALALGVPQHRSVVGVFSHLSFVIIIVPLCAIYTIMDADFLFVFLCTTSLGICYSFFGRTRGLNLSSYSGLDNIILFISSAFSIFVVLRLAFSGGVSFDFLSFNDVYKLRSAASSGASPVADRLVTISAYMSSSYIIIFGLRRKNLFFILLGMIYLYILYNEFGFKIFLFFGLLITFLYFFFMGRNPFSFLYTILFVFIFVRFFSSIYVPYISPIVDEVNELIVRRYFYTPGYISFAWYETFNHNPLVYMSNEFLVNRFLEYPFNINYSLVVSRYIYNLDFNPNTNIMGYGFANFGHIGILLYAFAAFFFMWFVDYASYKTGSIYLRLGALAPSTLFLEADLLVTLISFGFGIVVLLGGVGLLLRRTERVVPAGFWRRG